MIFFPLHPKFLRGRAATAIVKNGLISSSVVSGQKFFAFIIVRVAVNSKPAAQVSGIFHLKNR